MQLPVPRLFSPAPLRQSTRDLALDHYQRVGAWEMLDLGI
jgi:hypothetical protein